MLYTIYISKNRSEGIVETVNFFSIEVAIPCQSSQDLATQATKHLTHALLYPHPGDTSTCTSGSTTAEILINSTISTKRGKITGHSHSQNLCEHPPRPIQIHGHQLVIYYNLYMITGYTEIQKCMYDLPQAGILANELIHRRLALDGYHPTEHTHGLRKHETRPVWFS
jgi:hypothetical protein